MEDVDVGQILRDVRADYGAIAREAGLSKTHLQHISAGIRKAGLETRRKLLAAFEERQKRMGRIIVELRASINAEEQP